MLLDLLSGDFNIVTALVGLLSALFVVFCTTPIHEYAHALAADKLGDPTPRYNGRLTLNPLAHIDYLGALLIILAGFGYAKPVPVNPSNFRKVKRDMAIVGLAGPVSNIIVAAILILIEYIIITVFLLFIPRSEGAYTVLSYIDFFFSSAAVINLNLAVFNLIPLPPLDGSRVLFAVTSDRVYYTIMQYERYIYFAVLLLTATGAFSKPILFLSGGLYNGLSFVISLPFKLFGVF